MILDNILFDGLYAKALENPRRRMNFDLRTTAEDGSQRMLNVLAVDTVIPVHRHRNTTEVVCCLKGQVKELFYDDGGNETGAVVLTAGGECPALSIPAGQWHTLVALTPGAVIFEAKDGKYGADGSGTLEEYLADKQR